MSLATFKIVTRRKGLSAVSLVVAFVLSAGSAAGQSCPFVGKGGPPSISPDYYTTGGCELYKSGMFIRKGVQVDVNAVATADGACYWMSWDQGKCVPIKTEIRNVDHIQMYQRPPNYTWDNPLGRVDGITDPVTRTRAFYQTLDSRDTFHSTGPVRWTPPPSWVAGKWVLTVFSIAQTLACNIQPRESERRTLDVNVTSALHNGEPDNGSLDGGAQILNGTGYYHYFGSDKGVRDDAWGGPEAVLALIQSVGNGWAATYPGGLFGVGDISLQGGGPFSQHTYHQNGRDVDVRYVRSDWAWGEDQGRIDVRTQPDLFNRDATVDLIRRFAAAAACHAKIYVDSETNITGSDFPGLDIEIVPDTTGMHSNHFHLQTCDPDGSDDNVCRS